MILMTGYRIWSLLVIACAVMAAPQAALAGKINMKNIEALKVPEFMPSDQFNAATLLFKNAPNNDEKLAYEVRLPKGWVKEKSTGVNDTDTATLSKSVIQRLDRYVSPAQKHRRSFLTVESQELTYEIGARNWFLNYMETTGYTLEAISAPDPENREVEGAYVALERDITYAVRVKTFINGPRVIIVKYFVPVELFQDQRVIQAQSIASFRLTAQKVDQIEERRTHGFLDQAYFDFPISWTLTAQKVVNVERMRAMIYVPGPGGKLTGQINMYLTSRYIDTTLAKEVAQYRDKFALPNYTIGKKIDGMTLPAHDNMETSKTEIYALTPQKEFMMAYELWVTLMQSEGYYYIVTMTTPAREAEFYQWARNVRAYEIVTKTARQFDPKIDQYKYAQ